MRYYLVLLLYFPMLATAQVFDDFSDGDFTNNPEWTGSSEKFIVNKNNQLQLDDTEPGLSYLATANTMVNETEWQIWLKLSFSPSDNNNARFYLISDRADVSEPLMAIFCNLERGEVTTLLNCSGKMATTYTLFAEEATDYWPLPLKYV